jgi:flagellar biosynthesis chaperone FliJ
MPVSKPLRKLLRIRELEEEQVRSALEATLGEANRIGAALEAAAQREKHGRRMVTGSVHTGSVTDRIAGLEENRIVSNMARTLNVRLAAVEQQAAQLREHLLATRVQRKQAETLVEEGKARADAQAEHRRQQNLDDWYRTR